MFLFPIWVGNGFWRIRVDTVTNTLQDFFKRNEKIIGCVASILAILMFFSLIEILISNIRGDSTILIQPLATSFNCLFWSMYGYGRKDWFVLVPNLLGFLLGTITALSVLI